MKKLFILIAFVASACGYQEQSPEPSTVNALTSTSPASGRVLTLPTGVTAKYYDDWSNTVHTVVVETRSLTQSSGQQQVSSLDGIGLDHDGEWVIVGGGAYVDQVSEGAYVINSFPNSSGNTWVAYTHDHQVADSHFTISYAVGLRVDGVTRANLIANIIYSSSTFSVTTNHPTNQVTIPTGYLLIGGGGEISPVGSNFLIQTGPNNSTWMVAGKDHNVAAPAAIKAYAVGIHPTLPGYSGSLEILHNSQSAAVSSGPASTTYTLNSGYVPTCVGGVTNGSNPDRLVMGYRPPYSADPSVFRIWSKDCQVASSGTNTVNVVMLRKAP